MVKGMNVSKRNRRTEASGFDSDILEGRRKRPRGKGEGSGAGPPQPVSSACSQYLDVVHGFGRRNGGKLSVVKLL